MPRGWRLLWLLPLLAAVFFWPLWLRPDSFICHPSSAHTDLIITHWPNAFFARYALATWGQLPLWRPLILSGVPFIANPLSGLWYPPNLILLILPLNLAFNLLFVLHALWAGCGGYALARVGGASRAGGLLAAFTMMFAPKAVAHLAAGHVGLYCAFAWLPWLLWAVRRLVARGRPAGVATAAATAAMLVLADVRLGFYGGLAAAGYGLWNLVSRRRDRTDRRKAVLASTGAVLLAAALVAAQMVPLAAMAGRLNRGGLSLVESATPSLPPRYLLGLLIPDYGGGAEWMTYLGTAGLLLAAVGLRRRWDNERWWWGGLALITMVYALGNYTPLYGLLYHLLPPLGWLRGPARAWSLAVLALAVLAAHGLTALEGSVRMHRRAGLAVAGLGGVALAGVLGGWLLRLPATVVATALLWPAAGTLVALRCAGRLRARPFAALILALAVADLWAMGFTLYRVRPAHEVLAEGGRAAAWLAEQERPFRFYSPSYSIPQQTGALHALEAADGVDPFQLANYATFMRAATAVDLPGYSVTVPSFPEPAAGEDMLLAHRDVVPDLDLLGLLNVRYLVAAYPLVGEGLTALGQEGGAYLYQNDRAFPRAFVVERVVQVGDAAEALHWLTTHDPAQAAVVEGGPPLDGPAGLREAHLVEWTPNRIRVAAQGPGLLVLSEVYDPDWRAEVDGREVEVVRADAVLRGVYLQEGEQLVTLSYRPRGLWLGSGITALAWACAAMLWAAPRGRAR